MTTALAIALVLSLGFHLAVFGWHPYAVLYDHVPGFDRLRSPFRFSVIVQVVLVSLSAFALQRFWHLKSIAGKFLSVGVTALAVLAAVPMGLGASNGPRLTGMATTAVPVVERFDWVRYLAEAPPGVVAMVPFPVSGAAKDSVDTTVAMLAALVHHHPIVNGYTGLFPPGFDPLWTAMDHFSSRCAVEKLHERNVRYLVIAHDWFGPNSDAHLQDLGYRMIFDGETRTIYEDVQHFRFRNECSA